MGAIVVAIIVGLVAVGLVAAVLVFSALGIAGTKAINAVHDGGQWWVNRRARRHG
ncbi:MULTISPECIES: hypothetical protein [Saccharopolyspora]|uniref:Uncharacterized protein n=1 Tax=Saccharopolyspora gregorii TaxID=33914 RepID=A0ABP6RYF0_9PSEU|nr:MULTISPECIES: hypothetical protein [unclassified Saccharopolyspora]MCA1188548.1 hypothetical protein [Saccharopolyspora sp. 6T]MCA1193262.1 hypothetical protein [Saccharopolyspora sp. 6V]MCA1225909.1 hypothetical protein [Saccharopolyspora sp. 6M]MCA1279679.1 hypothetical protein [Saccharopolyspora sp. 7B]